MLSRVLLLAAFQVGGSFASSWHQTGHRDLDAFAVALLVAGPLSLLALRRAPWVALSVPLVAVVTWFGLDYPGGPVPAAFAIALIVTSLRGLQREARTVSAVGALVVWTSWALGGAALSQALGATAWTLVVVTLAEHARGRRERFAEHRKMQQEERRRLASEERLRIARELHDVLAHSVSLISVQAGVALHLLDTDPAAARTSLETIRDASRDTMAELRSTVGALRSQEEDVPLRPAPGLRDLPALVASSGTAGLVVSTEVTGAVRTLPAGVDLAAYRIIQEGLTNVVRHAGMHRSQVLVDYGADALTVRVLDEGTGAGAVVAGNGLTGMRERALALGGTLTAQRSASGFVVEAVLPL